MPPHRASTTARVLASMALLVFALAVTLIVLGSGGSGDGSDGARPTARERTATTSRTAAPRRPTASYTVKPGDTLGGIGQKTGTEVETLQELNPSLDPQALVAGQKIKLRP